ncbi:hypothetical protein TNCV_4082191 [Trichonephila clavipes]|nr:hypothetical protein TNCV_4082191 [Trichonephila clavipes]
MSRPKVFVTRPSVPKEGIDLLRQTCDVKVYNEDKPIPRDALLTGVAGIDGLLCLLSDPIDKEVLDAAGIEVKVGITFQDGDRFNSCQVIYSQFGLAIHQNDHKARRRFVEWAQNEIAVVPDFHKRILFSDEAHFWLNGYVNKQNCRIWSEANPQVYVETPLHPEKLTVWCALWADGILLQKR